MLKFKIHLLFTFYKSFFIAAFIISITCIGLFIKLGSPSLVFLIWFKIITLALLASFINSYKRKEFYYYSNLGISKAELFTYTLGFDILLFTILLILSAI